jgi:heme/copper-type cytochrome/quinol oxidase subunit 3
MKLLLTASGTVYLVLLAAYGNLRLTGSPWPRPLTWWPCGMWAALMTVTLIAASITWVKVLYTLRAGRPTAASRWMAAAILGGLFFEALQAKLWIMMAKAGSTLAHNPWGNSLFGAVYFLFTGFVSFHVFAGILYSTWVARKTVQLHVEVTTVDTVALYWHFVTGTWLLTYLLLVLPSTSVH